MSLSKYKYNRVVTDERRLDCQMHYNHIWKLIGSSIVFIYVHTKNYSVNTFFWKEILLKGEDKDQGDAQLPHIESQALCGEKKPT